MTFKFVASCLWSILVQIETLNWIELNRIELELFYRTQLDQFLLWYICWYLISSVLALFKSTNTVSFCLFGQDRPRMLSSSVSIILRDRQIDRQTDRQADSKWNFISIDFRPILLERRSAFTTPTWIEKQNWWEKRKRFWRFGKWRGKTRTPCGNSTNITRWNYR